MDKRHELLCALKDLVASLQRIPTREEFIILHGWSFQTHFKTWSVFVQAAGIKGQVDGIKERKKKITVNELLYKDINETLKIDTKDNKKLNIDLNKGGIAICPDIHFPFACEKTLTSFYEFVGRKKPQVIIQLGDLYDMFAHGKFPRSQNYYNPFEEIKLAHGMAKNFWESLYKISEKSLKFQILGNHDIRPIKRIIEAYPEGEVFFDLTKYFSFDNVETLMDYRSYIEINEIAFMHGHFTKLGDHMKKYGKSCVIGHSHRPGLVFLNHFGKTLFELNAGLAGDPQSKVMGYTPSKIKDWSNSFAYIDLDGPMVIPIE